MATANRDFGCLGVVHVPKAGGSALRAALSELDGIYRGPLYYDELQFGTAAFVADMPAQRSQEIASPTDLAGVVKDHRLVIGHFTMSSLLEAGCSSIAMQVREPRSRILSLYRYWQAQPESERAGWGSWGTDLMAKADLPLASFLTSPGVWAAVDNGIALEALAHVRHRRRSRALRTAMANVIADLEDRRAIIDWSYHSDRFLERVCEKVGETVVPPLGRENVSTVEGRDQKLDASTLRLLNRLTRVDRRFLDQMSEAGILQRRSAEELEREFETTAHSLGFHLG